MGYTNPNPDPNLRALSTQLLHTCTNTNSRNPQTIEALSIPLEQAHYYRRSVLKRWDYMGNVVVLKIKDGSALVVASWATASIEVQRSRSLTREVKSHDGLVVSAQSPQKDVEGSSATEDDGRNPKPNMTWQTGGGRLHRKLLFRTFAVLFPLSKLCSPGVVIS